MCVRVYITIRWWKDVVEEDEDMKRKVRSESVSVCRGLYCILTLT